MVRIPEDGRTVDEFRDGAVYPLCDTNGACGQLGIFVVIVPKGFAIPKFLRFGPVNLKK